jgi:hypothetical protein
VVNIRIPFASGGSGDDEIEDLRPSGIELFTGELVATDGLGVRLIHRDGARDRSVIVAGDEPGPLDIGLRRVGDDTDRGDSQGSGLAPSRGPGWSPRMW